MFQYRVGTYEAISELPGVSFELWHGNSVTNSKLKNYTGNVIFRHKQIPTIRFKGKTNNGGMNVVYHPLLFFRLISYNPDVILTEGASSIITASIAFLYCKLFRKKIIWWSLGALVGRKATGLSSIVHKWVRFIERHSDAIFAYSTQAESYFQSIGAKPERIFKAVNVINTKPKLAAIEEAGNIEKYDGFNIVFVGAIAKTKKLEMLVDAIKKLSQTISSIKLHIIGDGSYLPIIKDFVKRESLEDKVVFHGRVTDGLNVLLAKNQVLVLPGLGGLAIVDGMISSLPIIAGSADGTELDLIENGCNGFVTGLITKEYIIEKLSYLYNNPDDAIRMGKESFTRITGPFSFDHYMGVFNDCLKYVSNEK